MPDWMDQLDPDERKDWDEWVEHVRRSTLEQMDEAAFVMQLYSDKEPDIKFAVELGLSFLLDKPILALVLPGVKPPGKLALVADEIVEVDIDTEEGRKALDQVMERWSKKGGP